MNASAFALSSVRTFYSMQTTESSSPHATEFEEVYIWCGLGLPCCVSFQYCCLCRYKWIKSLGSSSRVIHHILYVSSPSTPINWLFLSGCQELSHSLPPREASLWDVCSLARMCFNSWGQKEQAVPAWPRWPLSLGLEEELKVEGN